MKLKKGEPKLQENPITEVPAVVAEVAPNVSANQEGARLMSKCADPSTPVDDNKLSEIIDERNRLVRSVMQQPTEVLRDIATLAVGWVMHELEVMERQHQAPSDQLSLVYGLRIIGLADGEYGNGFMVRTSENGQQMFDSSTSALVAQLHEHAGIEVEKARDTSKPPSK